MVAKRAVALAMAFAMAVGGFAFLAVGGPMELPTNWRGQITTRTWDGDRELFIYAFWCTKESMVVAWDAQSTETRGAVQALMGILATQFPGRQLLLVTVIPDQAGRFYWWPLNLAVTQDGRQYDVRYSDLLKYDDGFSGGRLYETVMGWVALPDGVDITLPLRLWYGEDSMTLGPFVE